MSGAIEIVEQYPIQIEEWSHLPLKQFMGILSENECDYLLAISEENPDEPECCNIYIGIERYVINETTNQRVFFAKTLNCFKIKNSFQDPTVEFFFTLIEKATFEFAKEYHKRTRISNLRYHKILKPSFKNLKNEILKTIDLWKKTSKNSYLKIPDWQITFRNLPEIPEHKRWIKGSHTTIEQIIFFKLFRNEAITVEEEKIFRDLNSFYKELDEKLIELDYESFNDNDIKNFRNYILYAFNYTALMFVNLTVLRTYRLVVNESIIKKNESITSIDSLKYPSLTTVRSINKYNRANTPLTNIFYTTENIDTALKEIKPPLNKLVTVGVWVAKDSSKKLISYPISHSEKAMNISKGIQDSTKAFEEKSTEFSELVKNHLRHYFKLLGREYTKKTNHHVEYILTAIFSEQILTPHKDEDKKFIIDCIIYPSVGNDFLTENLAIKPKAMEEYFRLDKVIEFEIEEAFYDKNYTLSHPEHISLAKIKNLKTAKSITNDGKIIW